jgi:hypothetical protein
VVLMMNTITLTNLTAEVPVYAALQRQVHDALLAQHPEWIESDGNCPQCDEYDRRFAQLLGFSLTVEGAHAH